MEVEAKPKKTTKAKVEAETKPKKATKAKKEKVEVVIDYNALSLAELKKIAKDKKIKGYSKMKKEELINLLK
ncbi:MAG: Rho termination factor N-terminal domain-containing protein [Bacilli bacterium]